MAGPGIQKKCLERPQCYNDLGCQGMRAGASEMEKILKKHRGCLRHICKLARENEVDKIKHYIRNKRTRRNKKRLMGGVVSRLNGVQRDPCNRNDQGLAKAIGLE